MLVPLRHRDLEVWIMGGVVLDVIAEHGFVTESGDVTDAGEKAKDAWRKLWRGGRPPYTQKNGHMVPNPTHLRLSQAEIALLRQHCHLDMPS